MDMLDALMAIGGVAFLIIAGGGYLLFSTGVVELPSPTGDGFMEALQPGLEDMGFTIDQIGSVRGVRAIAMHDDQAEFIFVCRKDPTQTLVEGNATILYDGQLIEGSVFGGQLTSMIKSSFYEAGYLCVLGSKSGRARSGVSGIRDVIEQYGTVMD